MKDIVFRTIMLKGAAGNDITGIEKTSSSGNVDTYTITLSDGSTETFTVTNGTSIESIEKTSTSGLIDTYTITLTDGSTTTFEVANGENAQVYEIPKDSVIGFDSEDETPAGYDEIPSPYDSALSATSDNAPQTKAVKEALDLKAPLASPSFTGSPTAPTQAAGNNSTRIATTAYVQGEKPSIGNITNLTTVSANTTAWQNVGSFSTVGGSKYLIVITAEFAGNSTGVRQIGISTTSGGAPMDYFRSAGANNMGTVKQQLQLVSILAPSSNTPYYINVAQNSNSGLEIKSKYSLIKLA